MGLAEDNGLFVFYTGGLLEKPDRPYRSKKSWMDWIGSVSKDWTESFRFSSVRFVYGVLRCLQRIGFFEIAMY